MTMQATIFASKQARLIPPCSFIKPFFTNTSGVVRSFLGGLRLFALPRDGIERPREIGVESFWYKEYDEHSIQEIMDRTMAGESVYPGDPPRVPFGNITRSELTERELDVLRELTASLTNEEIADKLHISVNTVKRHLQNILEKTGFESRLALAMNAKSLGLVVSENERTRGSIPKPEGGGAY